LKQMLAEPLSLRLPYLRGEFAAASLKHTTYCVDPAAGGYLRGEFAAASLKRGIGPGM